MACGCSKRAARAARGVEVVGYYITWPDGTTTPRNGGPLLTTLQAQVELRRRGGGTATAVERKSGTR